MQQVLKWRFFAILCVSLLLLWGNITAHAQTTINVPCDAADLLAAIITANATPEADIINLAEDCNYGFSAEDASNNDSALPTISAPLTINGHNATLERIDGSPEFRLIYTQSGVTLNDLTLTGGYLSSLGSSGGALYAAGNTRLNNVKLENNHAQYGGAAYTTNTLTVVSSRVIDNSADTQGGGLYNGSATLHVINSTIAGNSSNGNGGGISGFGLITVTNSIVSGNVSSNNGGGIFNHFGTTNITASTITGNSAISGGGVYNGDSNHLFVSYSIVWGNDNGQITHVGSSETVDNNIIQGGYTGTNNLDVDPLFVDPISHTVAPTIDGDYHILSNSPAIDAGGNPSIPDSHDIDNDTDTTENHPFDMDGESRYQYGALDLGADEVVYCTSYVSPYTVPAGDTTTLIRAVTCANAIEDETSVINLTAGTYSFTTGHNTDIANALPPITKTVIINGGGATLVRVDDSPEFRFFLVDDSGDLTLKDITLTGGLGNGGLWGGAIYSTGTLRLHDSTLTGNQALVAGAIYNNGTAHILRSTFSENTAQMGSALYNDNALTMVSSRIIGNSGIDAGSLYLGGTYSIVNTLVSGNGSGVREVNGDGDIINSTIASNGDFGLSQDTGTMTVTNSIIWGNETAVINTPTITHSIVEGGYTGTGNLDLDPLFISPITYTAAPTTGGDYHLDPASPAIGAGDNNALPSDVLDIDEDDNTGESLPLDVDGDARVQYTTVDMGFDEVDICVAVGTAYTVTAGDEAELALAISCANQNPDLNTLTLSGTYTFTSEDSSNNDSALPTITTPITINGSAIIERADGSPNFRLFSVTSGGNLTLNQITLTGGNIGAIRVINGALELRNSTLMNNEHSTNDGGAIYAADGATLVIQNSTLSANTSASRGGAIFAQGSTTTLINSTLSGNISAFGGGGIFTQSGGSTLTLINTLIAGNRAGFDGAALYLNGGTTASIQTSTIVGNALDNGQGAIYNRSSATLTMSNSIVWGNQEGIYNEILATLNVSYSVVQDGVSGTGNLNTDPLFESPVSYTAAPTTDGHYELLDTSPALNVGNNAALPTDTYDLDGDSDTSETLPLDILLNPRVYNFTVDMGAYENGATINRLTNGSFETAGKTATRADKWTPVNTKTSDKRLCTKPAKPITVPEGSCLYNFSGGTTTDKANRGIKQVINAPSWGNLGGTLTLSASVEGNKLKAGAVIIVQVTYSDNTTAKVTTAIPAGTYAFTQLTSDPLALTKPVSKVVVNIKIGRTKGRARIDELYLHLSESRRSIETSGGVRDGALPMPLPAAPDGFRNGN